MSKRLQALLFKNVFRPPPKGHHQESSPLKPHSMGEGMANPTQVLGPFLWKQEAIPQIKDS